tara:strand:- start:430 stop:645 length:216 start_codon:yes stop_codon:yes gene_type:complete
MENLSTSSLPACAWLATKFNRENEMAAKKKKDACYKKVVRAMPKNSAYRSGHMVRCRKVGAKNYNIGKKKK